MEKRVVFGHGEHGERAFTRHSYESGGSARTIYLNDWNPTVIVRRRGLTIEGTRVRVSAIVNYRRLGYSVKRILKAVPHLTRRQVEDALALYHDDKKEAIRNEIDEEIAAQQL